MSLAKNIKKQLVRRILSKEYSKMNSVYPHAYYYAKTILRKRWYIAEPLIMEKEVWWNLYCNHFDINR